MASSDPPVETQTVKEVIICIDFETNCHGCSSSLVPHHSLPTLLFFILPVGLIQVQVLHQSFILDLWKRSEMKWDAVLRPTNKTEKPTINCWLDFCSTENHYVSFTPSRAGAWLECTVLLVVVLVECGHGVKALRARAALDVEGGVKVERWVLGVDVSLDLGVGGSRHAAGCALVLALPLAGELSHAARVHSFGFLLALLGAHAWTRLPPAATAHAAVVPGVKALVVLSELALRVELHAVAEAAVERALGVAAVLVGAVPPYGRLLEELLRTVAAHEPLEAVCAHVAAVPRHLVLRVEQLLAHPAHPRRWFDDCRRRACGRFGIRLCLFLLLHRQLPLCEVCVAGVRLGHMREDVVAAWHIHVAPAAVVEEVGEVGATVEAAHVQLRYGRLGHQLAAHTAPVEDLVGAQQVLAGDLFLREAQAALAQPGGHRAASAWTTGHWFAAVAPPFARVEVAGPPFSASLTGLVFRKPAVLQKRSLNGLVDLHLVLLRFCVLLHFSQAAEELAAAAALTPHL